MTKRFEYRYNCDEDGSEFEIIDTNKDEYYPMIETNETVVKALVNLLNELNNENEQLKSKNRGLQSELQIFKEDATHSNLQINKLADENEQLKSRVEYLERKIDRERTSYQKQHEKWEEEIQKEINQELSNIVSAIEKGSCRSRWFS